jgi:hypothetical protein
MGSPVWGVVGTVMAGTVWFAIVVLYLAFYAGNLDLWQKGAVFLASAAVVGGAIAVYWIMYGLKSGKTSEGCSCKG